MLLRGIEFTEDDLATLALEAVSLLSPEELRARAARHLADADRQAPPLAEIHGRLSVTFERAAQLSERLHDLRRINSDQ